MVAHPFHLASWTAPVDFGVLAKEIRQPVAYVPARRSMKHSNNKQPTANQNGPKYKTILEYLELLRGGGRNQEEGEA